MFLMQRGYLSSGGDRVRKGKIIKGLPRYLRQTAEFVDVAEGARILGTMFGKVDDAGTVFSSLGLTV